MKRTFVSGLVLSAMLCAGVGLAEGLNSHGDFTFKRAKPPGGGGAKRITVQIDPAAARARATARAAAVGLPSPPALDTTVAAAPAPYGLEWYWDGVSPKLSESGPGRLATAVAFLTKAPSGKGVPTPRLQDMQEIAKTYGVEILKATIGTEVSPALVLAVIGIESAGKADAVSTAGATGLMQLMPATAERFGVTDRTIGADSIKGGVAYLDWLLKEFDRDPVMVLASYNAGENAVKKHAGVPPYSETRAYVPKVLAAWTVARGLCKTPPELVTDGCVFVVQGLSTNG